MRKLVRKSYTPVVPIANTCSIGYPHDGRADNAAYRHDRRADNAAYRPDRRADSLSRLADNATIGISGIIGTTVRISSFMGTTVVLIASTINNNNCTANNDSSVHYTCC